jgi:peroxiredoxin
MRRNIFWTSLVVIMVVAVATLFWPVHKPPVALPQSVPELPPEPEYLAVVNGAAITPAMVERELKISRLNVTTPLPPLQGDELLFAREEALNQLIDRQLILQAAARDGFILDEATVVQYVDLLYGSHSDEALEAALRQTEASFEDLSWWVGEIFTVESYITQVILADAVGEGNQDIYNEWFNQLRAEATVEIAPREEHPPGGPALIGQPAPDFTLGTPDGQSVSLSDYKGQVVLVNFWASWCPSCLAEMPDYEQVYQELSPDFVVLGVNFKESGEHVRQYGTGLGLSFPMLLDSDGSVTSRHYRVAGMPGSFIIDRQGTIIYRHTGPMSVNTLRRKLAEAGL